MIGWGSCTAITKQQPLGVASTTWRSDFATEGALCWRMQETQVPARTLNHTLFQSLSQMWHCRSDVTCQAFSPILTVPNQICVAAHPAYDCVLPFEEEGRTYYKCGVEFEERGQTLHWCPVKTPGGNDAIKTCRSREAYSYQQLQLEEVSYTETGGCADIGESNIGGLKIGQT